jgi:lysophospholipase L1-like esterase
VGANLLLGAAAVVLLLLALEIVARIVFPDPKPPAGLAPLSIADLSRPNLNGSFLSLPYRTNTESFRGPDYPPLPGEGVFRIAVTGDSVTMGWGVAEQHAYAAVLETLLNTSGDGLRYEVQNLGLAGINAHEAMERLERAIRAYSPQLLVYGFTINDIFGEFYKQVKPGAQFRLMARVARWEQTSSRLLWLIGPRWEWFKEGFRSNTFEYEAEALHNYMENPRAWMRFTEALDELSRQAREKNVCALVFIHTALTELGPQHPYLPVYDKVMAAARARGLSASSSFDVFQGLDSSDFQFVYRTYRDSHPNVAGHRALAESLRDAVGRLPEHCFTDPRAGKQPMRLGP